MTQEDSTTFQSLNKEIFLEFNHPSLEYCLVFEDNLHVAYAYLLHEENIVADVWLYNRGPLPDRPEWSDASKAPFLNSCQFASPMAPKPVESADEVQVIWKEDSTSLFVEILVRGELFGILRPGSRPGWAKLAIKDGPLAKFIP